MLGTRLLVTPYARRHRSALLDLTWTSPWTHKHLDWYKTADWIDRADVQIFLAWEGEYLVGYLGLSPTIDGCAWIRLVGIRSGNIPGTVIKEMWQTAEEHCQKLGISSIIVLMVSNWLSTYIPKLGFSYLDDIVTLNHLGTTLAGVWEPRLKVMPAEVEHMPSIAHIDRLAFRTPWRMSANDLRKACRIASNATVAVSDHEIVGYQISTRHREVGHLARLAVAPAHQGKRVGSALLHHLLHNFQRRGISTLSVNTQLSNLPSQRLYEQNGFFRNGFDIEVWQKQLR